MNARGAGATHLRAGPRDQRPHDVRTAPARRGDLVRRGDRESRIGAPILLSLPFLAALRREEPELRFDEPAVAALDELALAA